jgi:WD40 repeat protein
VLVRSFVLFVGLCALSVYTPLKHSQNTAHKDAVLGTATDALNRVVISASRDKTVKVSRVSLTVLLVISHSLTRSLTHSLARSLARLPSCFSSGRLSRVHCWARRLCRPPPSGWSSTARALSWQWFVYCFVFPAPSFSFSSSPTLFCWQACADFVVRLLDVDSRKIVREFSGHEGRITDLVGWVVCFECL